MSYQALAHHLLPLTPYLKMEGVTEICVNKPKEIFVERYGKFTRYEIEILELDLLQGLAALVAEFNDQAFPAPFVAGSLLRGERIQFVLPPACEKGKVICSIRCHHSSEMTLEDYDEKGVFDHLIDIKNTPINLDEKLRDYFQKRNYRDFIRCAIQGRKNILISGGTGTGKTTFLNACLKVISPDERCITIEDTREVKVSRPNAVHLIFNDEDKKTTSLNLFKACMRLRPDRIFLSELRGAEVWPYLRAANSGHPGSMSTVHADHTEGAFKQLVWMMQQAGSTSSEEQLMQYIKSIIHVVIQLKRDEDPARFMAVSDIWFGG